MNTPKPIPKRKYYKQRHDEGYQAFVEGRDPPENDASLAGYQKAALESQRLGRAIYEALAGHWPK